MSDSLSFFIAAACLVAVIGLTYALGKGSVVSDCKAVGVFHFGGEVFDCKLREAK